MSNRRASKAEPEPGKLPPRDMAVFGARHASGLRLTAVGKFGPEVMPEMRRFLGTLAALFQRVNLRGIHVERLSDVD